ncbi:hypothetical protein [Desertimonas flava]|uniref:hypothetical protein n=1 Tax=Desertimonas flava TaxID=2064846 RepID=UPI000E341587|nr:hypothetical protein [Desertimonas flava]
MDKDREARVDQAYRVLDEAAEDRLITGEIPIVVVKHPWWVTLKGPMYLLGLAMVLFAVSITTLAFATLSRTDAQREQEAIDECNRLWSQRITEASFGSRRASAESDVAFNDALLVVLESGDLDAVDTTGLVESNSNTEQALERDEATIRDRDAWVAAGQPMPCPVEAPDRDAEPEQAG